MRTHELKTQPPHFGDVLCGAKRVEVRLDDRGFAVGDVLVLREWDAATAEYTGRVCEVLVTHVLAGFVGLAPGYVALSVEPRQRSLFGGVL